MQHARNFVAMRGQAEAGIQAGGGQKENML
jgi:hypothetical protein